MNFHKLLLALSVSTVRSFATPGTKNNLNRPPLSLSMMSPWIAFDKDQAEEARKLDVWPLDEHNALLLNEVHPRDYKQSTPTPHEVYDLIAIGAGAGGLVSCKFHSIHRAAKHFKGV
jgi:hypothetical protein